MPDKTLIDEGTLIDTADWTIDGEVINTSGSVSISAGESLTASGSKSSSDSVSIGTGVGVVLMGTGARSDSVLISAGVTGPVVSGTSSLAGSAAISVGITGPTVTYSQNRIGSTAISAGVNISASGTKFEAGAGGDIDISVGVTVSVSGSRQVFTDAAISHPLDPIVSGSGHRVGSVLISTGIGLSVSGGDISGLPRAPAGTPSRGRLISNGVAKGRLVDA